MDTTRIVIAEDHPVYALGVEQILRELPQVECCATASDGRAAVRLALEIKPDVVLMDIQLPHLTGIEATRLLLQKMPGLKILAMTMYSREFLIVDMLEAGAVGYLDKLHLEEFLPDALRVIRRGLHYHCPGTSMRLAKLIGASRAKLVLQKNDFTEEEIRLIRLLSDECTTKEISVALNLSESTVDRKKRRLQEKAGAKTSAGLVLYAFKMGLLD